MLGRATCVLCCAVPARRRGQQDGLNARSLHCRRPRRRQPADGEADRQGPQGTRQARCARCGGPTTAPRGATLWPSPVCQRCAKGEVRFVAAHLLLVVVGAAGSPEEEASLVSHLRGLGPSDASLTDGGHLAEVLVLLGHEQVRAAAAVVAAAHAVGPAVGEQTLITGSEGLAHVRACVRALTTVAVGCRTRGRCSRLSPRGSPHTRRC